MTPLAPLRILLLGTLSWCALGLGIYCLWRYSSAARTSQHAVAVIDSEIQAPLDLDGRAQNTTITTEADDSPPPWMFLAGGLVLTLGSLGGRFPVLWLSRLLSKGGDHGPTPSRSEGVLIDRPDGTRLNVETYGNSQGPILVFSHGWSLDSTSWYYAKERLGDKFRLVLWDLPGLGHSRGPSDGNYSIEKMAGDLDAVIESVASTGKVYLVGHSIGGMITQIYSGLAADRLGDRVKGIILVHTTYTNPLRTMLGASVLSAIETLVVVPSQYAMIALAPLAWLSNWQSYFNGSMHLTTRLTSCTGHQTMQQLDFASWLSTKAWPGVVARGNLAMFDYDAQAALPKVHVPMLVISGDHDRVTKPIASDKIEQLAPECRQSRNPGGHLALLEFHDQVMNEIEVFVNGIDATLDSREIDISRSPALRPAS